MVLFCLLKQRNFFSVAAIFRFQRCFSTKFALRRSQRMDPNLKVREDPVVTKLDNELFKSLFNTELNDLLSLFKKYNHEIRIAGGAVRDLLMDKRPVDLDFATTATPTQMKVMFEAEGVRMINMNGEKHGTITPRINDKENFECTTLRIDVITDGRHAEVEFTKDWLLDSNRRDLTINSMFLGFDGSVYDYFFGYEDLKDRKVRFVGNADTRIKEDFLRILRYFRFYGRIAVSADNHDPETLKIIADNAYGLERISGERIWVELRKILEGNFAGELMMTIARCGLLKHIGFPDSTNIEEFERCWKNLSPNHKIHPMTYLSLFLDTVDEALQLHERLKFSAYDRDMLYFIAQKKHDTKNVNDLMPYQQMCLQSSGKPRDIKDYVEELLKYHSKWELYEKLKNWQVPRFPVGGALLMQHNCPTGKLMGRVMEKLKEVWVKNEFKPTADELVTHLPKIFEDLNIVDGKPVKKPKTN